MVTEKKCRCCGTSKSVDNFCKNKDKKDGYNIYCKKCTSNKGKIYREGIRNVERVRDDSDTRKCSKCGETKSVQDFFKQNDKVSGYMSQCKDCQNQYKENRDFDYKTYKAEYYIANKENFSRKGKEWRDNNKDIKRETDRIYRNTHKEQIKKNLDKTKTHRNKRDRERQKIRRKENPMFKMKGDIRNLINVSFKSKGFCKKAKTEKILGCTFIFFKCYIESKFIDGMTWQNKGFKGWHLDHIIPMATAKTNEEVIKLNHYTNFQPLWAIDNLSKGKKIPDNVQFKFV